MKNLIVSIGKLSNEEKKGKVCAEFPESGKHPKEQIEWVKSFLSSENFPESDRVIETYSDYIIREINVMILKGEIDYRSIKVVDQDKNYKSIVTEYGIEVDSIDDIIEDQNSRLENAYYDKKYGSE